ncbi:hypothetical protein [Granulicella arctica]|uniref:hypothetical protein n=1 Tax=Granulicella arctica TaxID=940613 RepID=UPI0021E07AFE|nr:hypothetical protein [Granulicella arctica]
MVVLTLLTGLAFAIHGYHPYSEDGGLYAAGVKGLLNPALYPHSHRFVEAHLRYSLFAPAVAAAVRITHLSLPAVLAGTYLLGIAATLAGVWLLAKHCYRNPAARFGVVALTATWLTVPVAGTSLILQDPYVTARSISSPCTLLAFAAVLNFFCASSSRARLRSMSCCLACLLIAALVHPLMAAYAVGDVLLLAAVLSQRQTIQRWGPAALCVLAFLVAGVLQVLSHPDDSDYVQVAMTRYYWFLSEWHWYEVAGLIAPLLILGGVVWQARARPAGGQRPTLIIARRALALMALASGTTATSVALVFAQQGSPAHLVARLQPLRSFQTIYFMMILTLGAALGEHFLRSNMWRWLAVFSMLGSIMFYVQRSTYPSSAHIEWTNSRPVNRWQQAFFWISHNTPTTANFALDADYISLPGEDAQSFRAIAERSALPDYSKDGGEASITPSLAREWTSGQHAQSHLSAESDAERLAALRAFNADWVVLQHDAQTASVCPYQNTLVKVCRLP